MSGQIVERRQQTRRQGDPHAEKLVALVTEVLGALQGLSLSIHDLKKSIEESHERDGRK